MLIKTKSMIYWHAMHTSLRVQVQTNQAYLAQDVVTADDMTT